MTATHVPDRTLVVDRPIVTIALTQRIDWSTFVADDSWLELRRHPYGRSYALDGDRVLFLFDLGAAVCDGADRLPGSVCAALERDPGCRVLPSTEETWFVTEEPGATGARIGWDRVVVAERRPELVAAIALLLAQSAALERYELAANALLEEALMLSRQLTRRGSLPFGVADLVGRVGRLTRDRLELARWFFLIDRPEATWEDPRVALLYDGLFANLELRQRHDAILQKLESTERATQTTLELWHGRRSHALEWAIVVLIVVEIVFGFWGLL